LIKTDANLLQAVKYHSSCSRNLFLKDRFGNNQLVEWTSDSVGLVTCFINATLGITLANPITAEGFDIRLVELNTLTNFDPFTFNKTDEVNGVELRRGESFSPSPITVILDLTVRQVYNFFTTVVGETLEGSVECNGDDFFEFIAGNPLPPTFPTVAPSVAPTFTPFPTPDPETTGCGLDGIITCGVIDGPTTNCNQLSAPRVTSCLTGANVPLTELRFQYTAQNCDILSTVECRDRKDGPAGLSEVYIEASDRDGDYVSGIFEFEDFITLQNPSGFTRGEVDIRISTVDRDKNDNRGDRIQDVVINTQCADGSLELGRDFGALRLTAFDNDQDGLQTLFATYKIIYTIENDSVFDANIVSAVVNSQISGPSTELIPGNPIPIKRFESIEILEETQTINLMDATAIPAFVFGMRVQGFADTEQMRTCGDFPVMFFSVKEA
jgi:hypothetical protein